MPLRAWLPVVASLALVACGDGSAGSSAPDASSDGDADTDTDIDTSWDGGPLTDCEGEAQEVEVCVPGGTYLMGCMPYDTQCKNDEKPMVEVTLSPFFVEVYEATYVEVIEFLNSLGEGFVKHDNVVYTDDEEQNRIWASFYLGSPPIGLNDSGQYEWGASELPACTMRSVDAAAGGFSWLGAKLFCEWKGKRLPTEAEWEAAARGQTKWIYPCAWTHKACWYGKYACCHPGDECFSPSCEDCCIPFEDSQTSDCTSPNGVKHMYGNAAEWILDWIDTDHAWCEGGCVDPVPTIGERPVFKGGCVAWYASYTRVSARSVLSNNPEDGTAWTGVRCVRSPISFDEPDAGK